MKFINRLPKVPTIVFVGSFCALLLMMLLTNPSDHIAITVLFFFILLLFLISGLYLATLNYKGKLHSTGFYKIVLVSLSIVIALMFRSSQSLTWLDLLILILTVAGVIFYTNQRIN